jgi:hypothetical protein
MMASSSLGEEVLMERVGRREALQSGLKCRERIQPRFMQCFCFVWY